MAWHYNHPIEPKELRILKALQERMALSRDDLHLRDKLQKGYEGEKRFQQQLKKHLTSDCIVLYDLSLDRNDSSFQLDCIIIQQRHIWHMEIKNMAGDYMLQEDTFRSLATDKEMGNPLHQMNRAGLLLNEVQASCGYNLPIKSFVLFVNPECALYQSQPSLPVVHPVQIRRFIQSINRTPSKLTPAHRKLAHRLFSIQTEHSHISLPAYHFDEMQKGIFCKQCSDPLQMHPSVTTATTCGSCGAYESRDSAILRSIFDFHLLFPESRITTSTILDWFGDTFSGYIIRKFLRQYLQPIGRNRHVYYVLPHRESQ